jgi:hypothetical protein
MDGAGALVAPELEVRGWWSEGRPVRATQLPGGLWFHASA